MLTVAKSYVRLFWMYFKFNLSSAMEYRISFFTQVIGMMLNNACFIFFWWILYSKVNLIGGYSFKNMMFLWALSSATFGFAFVIFGNVRKISNTIITGELDTYILQPKDIYINLVLSRSVTSAWGDLIYGFILFTIIYGFSFSNLLLFTLFTILGGILTASIIVIFETLTFFIGNASSISGTVFEFMISFGIYPETIYTNWVRWLIYTVLPVGFVVFVPLKILNNFSWSMLGALCIIDLLYVLFSYWFFRFGLKRYESGNTIVTRG